MSAPSSVFRFSVRLEGRTVLTLQGVKSPSGGMDVETETFPVGHKPDEPPLQRTFAFATQEKARRFTDEVLIALEYQSCEVNQYA